jgi:hypothetical protein
LVNVLLLSACAGNKAQATSSTAVVQPTNVATVSDPVDTEETTNYDQSSYEQYEIVTLLPKDAIPAIDDPVFLTAAEADQEYAPDELVIGVSFNGEARAYSINLLSSHEIVNDEVGGVKLSVTW